MNRLMIGVVVVGAVLACGSWASAALCAKCEDMMFIQNMGKCKECGAETSSGAFSLCGACSAKLNKCQACGAVLAAGAGGKPGIRPGVKPPAARPPIAVEPIEVEVPVAPVTPATKPADPATKPATPPGDAVKGEQGVTGKIMQMRGDFMPGPGAVRGKKAPVSCTVNVYAGKVAAGAAADKRPKVMASAKSDKDGNYRIALEPGTYTVIPDMGEMGAPSIMDGEGNLPTIEVKKGQWVQYDVTDTSQATF